MLNSFSPFFSQKRGFSLIEVLVSIFIFSIAFVGLITLSQQNIKVNNMNKNAMMASQLAQEGIEVIRQIREESILNGLSSSTIRTTKLQEGTYRVDFTRNFTDDIDSTTWKQSASILADNDIDADNDYILKMNSNGMYEHIAGATSTIYRRMVRIAHLYDMIDGGGDRIRVNCLVRYKDHNLTYDYTAIEELYDWR